MDTKVTNTNTTQAVCVLSHADLVRVLGFAVMVDAGLARDLPGTTVTAELAPAEADGEFKATVSVLIDHNAAAAQPGAPASPGADASPSAGDASLNSGGSPTVPGVPVIPTAAGG